MEVKHSLRNLFSKQLQLLIFLPALVLSCTSNTANLRNQKYNIIKIGDQVWMAENLKYRDDSLETLCYQDHPNSCEEYGILYNWESAKRACPEGWRLPTKSDILQLFGNLPGRSNKLYGKVVQSAVLEQLNVRFGGINFLRNRNRVFFGQGTQEMWFTSSDTTWNDPKSSEEAKRDGTRRIAVHFYKVASDSFQIDLHFSRKSYDSFAYCRCIKDTMSSTDERSSY